MQTKNLTIVFTDMKGFTTRTSLQSREEVERLLNIHDQLLRPLFYDFEGTVIKTIGDAFMVVFESPTNAVLCGISIQEALKNYNQLCTPEEKFEVRVAVNTGEVHIKDNDVFGEPVNIAARIEAIAEPGDVYFTEAVYITMNKNEIPSAEVGIRHLKGIPDQIKIYKVLTEKESLLKAQILRQSLAKRTQNLPKKDDSVRISDTNEPGFIWKVFFRNIALISLVMLFFVAVTAVWVVGSDSMFTLKTKNFVDAHAAQ